MRAKSNNAKQRGDGKNNATAGRPRQHEAAKNIYKYSVFCGKRIRGHGAQTAQRLRGHVTLMLQRRQIDCVKCVGGGVVALNGASACDINPSVAAR